jgi:hypothetical protein
MIKARISSQNVPLWTDREVNEARIMAFDSTLQMLKRKIHVAHLSVE